MRKTQDFESFKKVMPSPTHIFLSNLVRNVEDLVLACIEESERNLALEQTLLHTLTF